MRTKPYRGKIGRVDVALSLWHFTSGLGVFVAQMQILSIPWRWPWLFVRLLTSKDWQNSKSWKVGGSNDSCPSQFHIFHHWFAYSYSLQQKSIILSMMTLLAFSASWSPPYYPVFQLLRQREAGKKKWKFMLINYRSICYEFSPLKIDTLKSKKHEQITITYSQWAKSLWRWRNSCRCLVTQ